MPLFQLQEDVITCVHFASFHLQEEENAVEIQKVFLNEVSDLVSKGYKEITLLGQNVDSYLWYGGGLKKDFNKATPLQKKTALRFENLLSLVAKENPKIRIRFFYI